MIDLMYLMDNQSGEQHPQDYQPKFKCGKLPKRLMQDWLLNNFFDVAEYYKSIPVDLLLIEPLQEQL
jgi:hypothetical protein